MSGTYTHANIFYKPSLGSSGTTTKGIFDRSLDKTARFIAGCSPIGQLVNGKIMTTVHSGSNLLEVSVKTLDNATPSTSNPVFCRLASRVVTITSALSMTKASTGALVGYATESWLHLAMPTLSGYEVDLFTYLGWSTTQSKPFIAVSREGWHTKFMFQNEAAGHGALCSLATGNSSFPYESGDEIAVCARFATTLTTPNTWSSPASGPFLIQGPITYTRMLEYNPCWSLTAPDSAIFGYGGTITNISSFYFQKSHYQYQGHWLNVQLNAMLHYTAPSTHVNKIIITAPISSQDDSVWGYYPFGMCLENPPGTYTPLLTAPTETNIFMLFKDSQASFTPATITLSGRFSAHVPGQRRQINW